jgi:hypothetical protein
MVTGVVIRIRDGRSGVRLLAATRDFSAVQNVQNGSGARPASYSVGTDVLAGREVDYLPPGTNLLCLISVI